MKPQQIFETGLIYHHYANTAYPLTPGSFKEYRIDDASLIGEFLKQEWAKADVFSLYVHIPFCTHAANSASIRCCRSGPPRRRR